MHASMHPFQNIWGLQPSTVQNPNSLPQQQAAQALSQPWFIAQQNGANPQLANQWVASFNQSFPIHSPNQYPYGFFSNPYGYNLNPGYGLGMAFTNGGALPLVAFNGVQVNAFGWQPTFTGTVSTPVGANQHSAYWGDPHVADADRPDSDNKRSIQFDVTGGGFFQLLRDRTLNVNVEHRSYDNWAVDVTDKVGINLAGANIVLTSEGKVTVGQYDMQVGEIVTLRDDSVLEWTGKELKVSTPQASGEYDLKFTIVDTGQWNNGKRIRYIDTDITTRGQGVGADGFLPTGILGEGFDPNSEVRNGLQRDIASYKRPSLLEPSISPNGIPFNAPQAYGPLPPNRA